MEYPALFEPAEEGGFVITFPGFGGGVAQGDNEEDAREMARYALLTMIGEHIRKGEDLPRPTHPRGRKYRMIQLPALQAAKAGLYLAFRRSKMKRLNSRAAWAFPKRTWTACLIFATTAAWINSRPPSRPSVSGW